MKTAFSLAAFIAVAAVSGCATQITPNIEIGPSPVISPPSNADISPKSTRRDVLLDRNFVSLQFDVTGGYAGAKMQTVIRRNSVSFVNERSYPKQAMRTVAFTTVERKQLLKLLNDTRFTKLVGNYRQNNMMDGFNQTVTLRTKQYGKTDIYVVQNYGDLAPKAFYKVTAYLNDLQNQKFPPPRPRD